MPVPCMHVTDLGDQPTDDAIWIYARDNGWTILTKDTDYFDRLALEGAPPKIVWLRTGNLRRNEQTEMLMVFHATHPTTFDRRC